MARQKRRSDGLLEKAFTYKGKRYHVYGSTKAELEKKVAEKKEQLEASVRTDNLSLNEYYQKWAIDWQKTVKPSTVHRNNNQFNAGARVPMQDGRTFGEYKLFEVEPQHIKHIREFLLSHYYDFRTDSFTDEKHYSTSGINCIIGCIGHVFATAVNDRVLTWNPCRGIKELRRTEEKARDTIHRALTREETAIFLTASKNTWYFNVYRLMLSTGMRCGEVGGLKLSDIKKDHIEVRRTVTQDADGTYIMGEDAKTKSGMRNIPMTDTIREIIKDQKALNDAIFGEKIRDINSPLFMNSKGGFILTKDVDSSIRKICKRLNMDKIGSHCFRDTFATRAIESGMNPKTLQTIMGHANIGITMNLYAHVMESTKVEEMQKVIAI